MLSRLAVAVLTALPLASSACIPAVESRQRSYPLIAFNGPDTLPAAPEGTVQGIAMDGTWRVSDVQHQAGDPTTDHFFERGWVLRASNTVNTVQGVRPETLLPAGVEWRLNRVDDSGVALGFGFATPRGNLDFLHFAFVAAATDANRARAIEAMHYRDVLTGAIVWSIWSVELERVPGTTELTPPPAAPVWPH